MNLEMVGVEGTHAKGAGKALRKPGGSGVLSAAFRNTIIAILTAIATATGFDESPFCLQHNAAACHAAQQSLLKAGS